MKQNPAWPGLMWQWRGHRKQCTRPLVSGFHQPASWSVSVFWRIFKAFMGSSSLFSRSYAAEAMTQGSQQFKYTPGEESLQVAELNLAPLVGPVHKAFQLVSVFPG